MSFFFLFEQKLIKNTLEILSVCIYEVIQSGLTKSSFVIHFCLLAEKGEFYFIEYSSDSNSFKPLAYLVRAYEKEIKGKKYYFKMRISEY